MWGLENFRKLKTERHYRRLLDQTLLQIPPYPAGRHSGRGVVLCAGTERCFTSAWIHLHILRNELQCKLPIEIWHFGKEEWNQELSSLIAPLNLKIVDGSPYAASLPRGSGRGYALKITSLFYSSFEEVLFLDADNVPVRDPEFLFSDPDYRQSGNLFWPDIRMKDLKSRIWSILGIPFMKGWELETGQLLIHKEKFWKTLFLAMHINEHFPFYYQHIHGDKDSFYLAAARTGQALSLVPHKTRWVQANRYQSLLNQFAPDGSLLFQHRTQADWNLFGVNPAIPGFLWENECRKYLELLSCKWSGQIHSPAQPEPESSGQVLGKDMGNPAWFMFERKGCGRERVEFLPGGKIGTGAGWDHGISWRLESSADGETTLVLDAPGEVLVRLRAGPDGIWTGKKLFSEEMEMRLAPSLPPAPIIP